MPARGQGEWDELTGDFVNIIALRTRLDDDCELQEALRRVRAAAFQGMAHQDYPFAALLEQLRIPRTDMHPVFQASFTWQKARSDAGLHRLWAEDGGAGMGGIPLAIVASASTGALPISCVSSPCDSRRAASEATVRGP